MVGVPVPGSKPGEMGVDVVEPHFMATHRAVCEACGWTSRWFNDTAYSPPPIESAKKAVAGHLGNSECPNTEWRVEAL